MEGDADQPTTTCAFLLKCRYYYLYFLPFVFPTDPKYKGKNGRFISFHNFVK